MQKTKLQTQLVSDLQGHRNTEVFVSSTIDFKTKIDSFILSEIDIALQCTCVGEVEWYRHQWISITESFTLRTFVTEGGEIGNQRSHNYNYIIENMYTG